jgi:hypothetical protein
MATAELMTVAAASRRAPARLGDSPWARYTALGVLGLLVATALGAGAELVDPSLFRSMPPHPTLSPSVAAIAAIFATNLRVLAAPFLLITFAFAAGRRAAVLGDALVAGILVVNGLRVGLAIGRWQARLLPYLPHLPFEYLAAAVASAAWLNARRDPDERPLQTLRASAGYAAVAVVLLAAAAIVEVLSTPHRP